MEAALRFGFGINTLEKCTWRTPLAQFMPVSSSVVGRVTLGIRRPVEAERRQVTVLFTDMVGFTTFSERSGEEAAYTLMRSLSKLMGEGVREQGGVVQGFTGDGIMAVFGAPVAFEDAPLRACRAALSILKSLKEAGPELEAKHGVRPQMRIGLNTGAAVVGKVEDGADAGVTVLGDTVNFAARLQALADPELGAYERGDPSLSTGDGRGDLRWRPSDQG